MPLIPVGLARRVLVAAWDEVRHVLVAGSPGGGAPTVVASTVAALAARFRPDALRLWTIGARSSLPPELLALPHQVGAPIDPADPEDMAAVVATVRDELVRRMRQIARMGAGEPAPERPLVVLLVPDLTEGSAVGEAGGDAAGGPAAGAAVAGVAG